VAPHNSDGIILANPHTMSCLVESPLHNDPLKALDEEHMVVEGEGHADDSDIFKALPIIEDVEMSSESTKRKRKVEGDGTL